MIPFNTNRLSKVFQSILFLIALSIITVQCIAGSENSGYDRLKSHVKYLASDELEGRGIGTKGLEKAADYIVQNLQQSGIAPLFGDSYRQPFEMSWGAEALDGTWIVYNSDTLRLDIDMIPLGFSSSGVADGSLLFAGYGITATEYNYDDYAGIDADGKIVLMFEGEPANQRADSKFAGTLTTQYAETRNKLLTAKNHGASGVILLRNEPQDMEDELLPDLKIDEPYRELGIPVVYCKRSSIRRLFPRFSVDRALRSIDANEAPRSMMVSADPVKLQVRVKHNSVLVENIGGIIPGDEDRIVIIGAHYDHLGYGQMGTTEPGVHAIHNGADDNASGVALLLETAAWFSEHPTKSTIWIVSFTGEEVGLTGSSWFVNHPPDNFDKAVFMYNFDMVGRMRNNTLTLLGINSGDELRDLATESGERTGVELAMSGDGYGPSDQTSFYIKGIPVLQAFTGAHVDYHSPRDDADKINYDGMVKVLEFTRDFIGRIANPGISLTYVKSKSPKPSGGGGKDRPYLGTIPDFTQPDSLIGVRLQGVRSGSPADQAGLQQGDILIRMDDIIIDNLYDFVFALRSRKPGDQVELVFLRDGSKNHSTAVLGQPAGGSKHGR